MPRANAVDRVQEVYATSYRRLVGQLTGVTGDPVEADDAVMASAQTTQPTLSATRSAAG